MLSSEKLQIDIIALIKSGSSVKEISKKLKISKAAIYDFLRTTIPSDNKIQFDRLPVSTQIKLLIIEEDYKSVLELCNKPENIEDKNIQEQKVKVLLLEYEKTQNNELLEQALKICQSNDDIKSFDRYRKKIESYIKNTNINKKLTVLLTNIYYETISIEEIKNSEVEEWEKALLLICYYEKNNKKAGLTYLKKLKVEYQEKKEKLKILNILYDRLNSKKNRIFDVSIYSKYLGCTIDQNCIKTVEHRKNDIEKINSNTLSATKESNQIDTKSIVPKQQNHSTNVKYNRYNRYSNIKNNKPETTKLADLTIKKIYIKDIFPREVLEIGKYLYVEMNDIKNQRNAIKAWDNFECLINKTIDDVQAMNRITRILQKFQKEGLLSQTENYKDIKSLKKNIYQ